MEGFGKAKFGGNKRNWWKLKDGDNGPYRILPPIGNLQEEGRWSVYYKLHYGYRNSKNEMRTFESPEVKNYKTKMIDVPDAALDRINQLKAKLEEAQKAGDTNMVEQLLKLVGGKKSRYNLDSNHYMNVMDLQGNIGILKIRHRAKLALDAVIKTLRDNGIEPLDPETGRWFTFSRSGTGRDTVYQASVYKKKFNIEGVGPVEQDLIHTITPEIAKRCFVIRKDGTFEYKEAARLDTLYKKPTAEEVERIVKEGPKAVDEILDATEGNADDTGTDDDTPSADATALAAAAASTVPATTTTTVTANAAAPAPAPLTPSPTLTVTATPVVLAPTPVAPAPAPTVVTAAPAANASGTPKTTAQSVAEQSDEDFLKSLGI